MTTNSRFMLLLLPLAALPLAACGGSVSVSVGDTHPVVSADSLSRTVQKDIQSHSTGDVSDIKVTCAGSVDAVVGKTQNCDVADGSGGRTGIHVTIDHVDGDDWHAATKPYLHGVDVATTGAAALHLPSGSLTCPDLDGVASTSVDCTVTGSSQTVSATVTKVEGLHFALNFKAR